MASDAERPEPTDAELQRFAAFHLRGMGEHMTDPDVIAETISEHRDLWVRLYLVTNWPTGSEGRDGTV